MNSPIWSENYKIASYLVNLRGQAGLYAVLNLIQDVGWLHAMQLKISLGKKQGWVFTRQKLVMTEWPAWNQTVSIRTWLRFPDQGPFLLRDYELFLENRKIGECTSTFTVMDMQTRKLVLMDWSQFPKVWREDGSLAHIPGKIAFSSEVEDLAQFQVRNSDLDMNNHVNNTKYSQWILDAIPLDILRAGVNLEEYEVNFLAESKSGDTVTVQRTKSDLSEGASSIRQFQGIRTTDGKPVFAARLRFSEVEQSSD
jgi:medium-chain acyl-[acyl-carrier-protein] hydrolase